MPDSSQWEKHLSACNSGLCLLAVTPVLTPTASQQLGYNDNRTEAKLPCKALFRPNCHTTAWTAAAAGHDPNRINRRQHLPQQFAQQNM